MQGATHRAGGVAACMIGYTALAAHHAPLIEAAPIASLVVLYPFALWGSTASDLDHHPGSVWDEVKLVGERSGHTIPSQDPVSRTISHILHLTRPLRDIAPRKSRTAQILSILDCRHRSWQTHSELPFLLLLGALTQLDPLTTNLGEALTQLVITGIILGLIAHLTLDLLTPEGLPFATGLFINRVILRKKILPERIKIIPHVKPRRKGEPGFFSTGGTWETKVVFNILHAVNLGLLGWLIYRLGIAPYTSFQLI